MKKYFILIILLLFVGGFYLWQGIYLPPGLSMGEGGLSAEPASQTEKIFVIEKGEGGKEIAQNLKKEGLIRSEIAFRFYAISKMVSGKLQAGRYLLSSSMTVPEIVEKFVAGDIIKEKITIIEGWTIKDIEREIDLKLNRSPALGEGPGCGIQPADRDCEKTQFSIQNLKVADFQEEFDFLKDAPPQAGLEGYLFPDTYFLNYNASSAALENVLFLDEKKVVRKILRNFDKKLTADLREEIRRQGKTIFEIVTMASLIEKEVNSPEDKKLVSGVLWKRLKTGIPLQVDATITYITGKKSAKVSLEETKIDSPYNTYKYQGLPIGPISNPGIESILAAVYPENSDFWYYLSTPEGETIFSKTLKEHNIVKAKYLK